MTGMRTDAPLTGRKVHTLVRDGYSLWTAQEVLKALTRLGLVNTQTIGRAGVHTVKEDRVAVAPLRALLDPIVALTDAVREAVDVEAKAVILFGSIARGEATIDRDVDLAVIAPAGWDGLKAHRQTGTIVMPRLRVSATMEIILG